MLTPHRIIFIMGVAGAGKTTIGRLLSARTGYAFYDADDFHSKKNIDKMKTGQSLSDNDRWPWLNSIHEFVKEKIQLSSIIIACSALKQSYRNHLTKDMEDNCKWIFLKGEKQIISERIKNRPDHFMPIALLSSQFEALEIPEGDIIEADITKSPEEIIALIISKLK